jgi:ferredoxin-NADP reductase
VTEPASPAAASGSISAGTADAGEHGLAGPTDALDTGGRRSPWRDAVVVSAIRRPPRAVELRLDVPERLAHLPGQHYVVRLTAEDGYQASRSYSVASTAADPLLELYVERLEDGEVSTYLADQVEPGDHIEVRGPIGGWFTWDATSPALGVGGGSGVVPLISMLRRSIEVGRPDLLRLAVSARGPLDLPYATELSAAGALIAFTRRGPGPALPGQVARSEARPLGRLVAADLEPLIVPGMTAFVCGSAGFAEHASSLLVGLGVPVGDIRVERFGPSGS